MPNPTTLPIGSAPAQLHITFPENLPVSAMRCDIMAAIAQRQVVVVCGETGSGKTTQLPKMALALGRGLRHSDPKGRIIGHTQPRRIAASSVAKRIAQELSSELGDLVGYKVRFQDRIGPRTSVKLMTDGILLAETQSDPLLRAYDTLIIDEAHERSLNIDFLLGFLRQLLPKRPDLKVIVTSATIDAERFANYFADAKGDPAPVIQVSGRTFPVEVRWRAFEENKDSDLNTAMASAVDELWRGTAGGDILIFLPGEREIREAADHLRKHLSHQPLWRDAEVLPLFSRLSQTEQERIFNPSGQRRIVLATNVAETSLTVPGIRYVVDAGTARVKRYSIRQKVEQLMVEPISQAAANQRAGRCGRVADGICIRLYDEASFAGRPRFTDPEILRSSLAGVILRMKTLHLHGSSGAVEDFPFIDPPPRRAFADGYALLHELGGVDEDTQQLTPIGHQLAKLPLDPRVGRMILAGRDRHALAEVLVIAAALSVQDVRDRPIERQAAADQAHAKFNDEKSEFSSTLRLWQWLEQTRGAKQQGQEPAHKLSNRQTEQLLRDNFVNVRRVREWRDTHSQLMTVATEHQWRLNTEPAGYEALHKSLLAGLLGNIGLKSETEEHHVGARNIKFHRHPGVRLGKKLGRWVVAAELVETTRLFARCMAVVEPQWIEEVGTHLLKKQVSDPQWEKRSAQVVAHERANLYGLPVYQGRRVNFAKLDPALARTLFIRAALVEGQMPDEAHQKWPFWVANQKLIAQVAELEHKSRRQDVLVDDELIFAFYDHHIPADVCTGAGFEHWYKHQVHSNPQLLKLTREELMRHEAAGITTQAFPKMVRLGGVDCTASYLHDPSDAKDGLSVTIPLFALNQVAEDRCDWLVPGMLKDKVLALLKTLHQRPRSRLVPLPDTADRMTQLLSQDSNFGHGNLQDAVLKLVREATQLDIKRADIKADMLSPHHLMHLRVVDEHGRQLGAGRHLAALKADLGHQARGAFQALAQLKMPASSPSSPSNTPEPTRQEPNARTTTSVTKAPSPHTAPAAASQRYTDWTFGELPELMEIQKGQQVLIGFPALIDLQDAVGIEVFDEPDTASQKHRAGLRRLFALQMKDALKYLDKNIPDLPKMGMAYMALGGTADELRQYIINLALDRAFLLDPLPCNAADFRQRSQEGRGRLSLIANEVAKLAAQVLQEHATVVRKLKDNKPNPDLAADINQQLQRLLPKHFLQTTPWPQLQHMVRYLKAMTLRLDKYKADPARDMAKASEIKPQEQRFWRLVAERKGQQDARVQELRWLFEELRVSFFAQELRTPQPVSIKRIEKAWGQIAG